MTRFVVVGMGVQGTKRRRIIGDAPCVTVDPAHSSSDFADLRSVPPDTYDVAFLCVLDRDKLELTRYLVSLGKHILIEKPFLIDLQEYKSLQSLQRQTKSTIYVAYNHRFEPHVAQTKYILESGQLGDIYSLSLTYGNGTSERVRTSPWRDSGLGVLSDLGSHLLDMLDFWLGLSGRNIDFVDGRCLENSSLDSAVFRVTGGPSVWCETSLLSWRNDFRCDIRAQEGSLHIASLCKWGPSSLTLRERVRPSGRPPEHVSTLIQEDPTWALEHSHFLNLVGVGEEGNLSSNQEIGRMLDQAAELVRTQP